jgi:hypothetical protein
LTSDAVGKRLEVHLLKAFEIDTRWLIGNAFELHRLLVIPSDDERSSEVTWLLPIDRISGK